MNLPTKQFTIAYRGPNWTAVRYKIFNYILKILYLDCPWKELPIDKDGGGRPETHYTRIYRIWRRWVDNRCMDAIFAGSVSKLHQDGCLDTTVIHGDGTTRRKRAAITSASAATRRSRATRSSPSATAGAT